MTNKRVKEIRSRLEKATDGPWNTGPETGVGHVWVYAGSSPLLEPIGHGGWMARLCQKFKVVCLGVIRTDSLSQQMHESSAVYNRRVREQRRSNADFIANTPQDISDLLDTVEEQGKENERLKLNLKARVQDICDVVAYLSEQDIEKLMNYMDHHNKNNAILKSIEKEDSK